MQKLKKLSSLLLLPLLSSCFYLFPTTERTTDNSTSTSYKTPTYTSDFKASNLTLTNLGISYGYKYLPSKGDINLLVIPVQFKDDQFTQSELDLIQKGFFGSSSMTGWESVSSYYEKSSYGKLKISGEVTKTVELSSTVSEFAKTYESYQEEMTYTDLILDNALKALSSTLDLSKYDNDKDGVIDGVWMVYSTSYDSNTDAFWAYTTWSQSTTKVQGLTTCCYAWASVEFFKDGYYSKADAHTFIHETGHMLGLDDYYSYDYDGKKNYDMPVGGVDMMDYNIGDHCAYSKYALSWATPTLLTDEYLNANDYSLTLNSFTETGESYLIPVSDGTTTHYNSTPFDEYILIEYYTPTNLNEKDKNGYDGGLGTYSKTGVLVYHINATVGKMVVNAKGETIWDGYAYDKLPTPSSEWGYKYAYIPLYSNTASYSWDTTIDDSSSSYYRGRLISLLPATEKKITRGSSNSSLFQQGDEVFKENELYDFFLFDDGNKPAYSFKVNSTSSASCNLIFEKN